MISKLLYTVALLLLVLPNEYANASDSAQLMDMTYRTINFLIMSGILYWALANPLRNYLSSRSDAIKKSLDDARIAKEEAEKIYMEYKHKLERLTSDMKGLTDSLIDEGNKEKERIIVEADKVAQRIKEQARFTAEQEIKKARIALKDEMAGLIAEAAGNSLRKEINSADQERLIKDYLSSVGSIQ